MGISQHFIATLAGPATRHNRGMTAPEQEARLSWYRPTAGGAQGKALVPIKVTALATFLAHNYVGERQ